MGNLESIKQADSVLDNFNPSLAFPRLLRCINKVRNELIQRFESLENLMTLLCQIDGKKNRRTFNCNQLSALCLKKSCTC